MITELIVVTLGSFVASLINGMFATGGIYILLAATSSVFPLTIAVPLQSVLTCGSLVARVVVFWSVIQWPIVAAFGAGSVVGVIIGTQVFVTLSEQWIARILGSLLLVLIWMPEFKFRLPMKHPFLPIGILHSFIGTIFGVGALLQPAILRTSLLKAQITGTLAACLITMDIFKFSGYVSLGFDYSRYLPHIALATITGFLGTWIGKRQTHRISESVFRRVFKWLITLVALRLLYKGWIGIA